MFFFFFMSAMISIFMQWINACLCMCGWGWVVSSFFHPLISIYPLSDQRCLRIERMNEIAYFKLFRTTCILSMPCIISGYCVHIHCTLRYDICMYRRFLGLPRDHAEQKHACINTCGGHWEETIYFSFS